MSWREVVLVIGGLLFVAWMIGGALSGNDSLGRLGDKGILVENDSFCLYRCGDVGATLVNVSLVRLGGGYDRDSYEVCSCRASNGVVFQKTYNGYVVLAWDVYGWLGSFFAEVIALLGL